MGNGETDSRPGGLKFSSIFIGLLGVVAGAIVVTIYHLIAVGWCSRRRATPTGPADGHQGPHQIQTSQQEGGSSSTSNSIMAQLIPIIRYSKELEGDTCAVCLCEFKEAEQVRVLPECFHLFHVACVDTWLNSHSSCPLCRADTGGSGTPRAPEAELRLQVA
ncbi:RING-H2 finger protein ATL52-like [Corylus avellana]|uniref:RING-H2 finger protein ATL52-like n=1 Tax=Corylus avellana TaxID=13451 RepID=UPI001E1F2AD3|nr:RING-H2 finger protein ATL52-like [Corylus avellana]